MKFFQALKDDFGATIEDHPFTAVFIVFVAGVVLGAAGMMP